MEIISVRRFHKIILETELLVENLLSGVSSWSLNLGLFDLSRIWGFSSEKLYYSGVIKAIGQSTNHL